FQENVWLIESQKLLLLDLSHNPISALNQQGEIPSFGTFVKTWHSTITGPEYAPHVQYEISNPLLCIPSLQHDI
ncbi:hypothetical protein, partial [Klebsiella variicola]